MGPMETVYERSQRTGFIAGPNNRMVNGSAAKDPAPEAPAPNYRDGEDGSQCRDCTHYNFDGRMCTKYNFAAKPLMTCDAFEAAAPAPEQAQMPMEVPEESESEYA
jgi:hypothetical protein